MSRLQTYDSIKAERLWQRYREHKDLETRNELVIANESLVGKAISMYFRGYSEDLREDLRQEGLRGLVRAVELFNPELGHQFSTYALLSITRFIRNWLQRESNLIRLPSGVYDKVIKIESGERRFKYQSGRPPVSDEELAEFLSLPVEQVTKAKSHGRLLLLGELDRPVGKNSKSMMSFLAEPEERGNPLEILTKAGVLDCDPVITIAREVLSKRDFKMLLMRFEGITLSKIAQELKLPRQRVSKTIDCSLEKLRTRLRVADLQ